MNKKYNNMLKTAANNGYAIAAFNVTSKITADAVIQAANEVGMPVITQVSTSTVKKMGINETIQMLEAARKNSKVDVGTHLDHCPDVDFAIACIEAGFDSVMFDGSILSIEENISKAKEIVKHAKLHGVDVEGEVGVIEGVEDGVGSEYGKLASFEDTMNFIRETEVDSIAPAIGTAHGVYKGVPNINYQLIKQLKESTEIPIVIHGGTGLAKEEYQKLIAHGGSKINISTALKHAYLEAIKSVANNPEAKPNPIELDEMITYELKTRLIHYIRWFKG